MTWPDSVQLTNEFRARTQTQSFLLLSHKGLLNVAPSPEKTNKETDKLKSSQESHGGSVLIRGLKRSSRIRWSSLVISPQKLDQMQTCCHVLHAGTGMVLCVLKQECPGAAEEPSMTTMTSELPVLTLPLLSCVIYVWLGHVLQVHTPTIDGQDSSTTNCPFGHVACTSGSPWPTRTLYFPMYLLPVTKVE